MNGWCRAAGVTIGLGMAMLALGWGAALSCAAETRAVAVSSPASPAVSPAGQAEAPAPPPFVYTKTGKADPFKPFVEPAPQPKAAGEPAKTKARAARPISPLQQADLGQFRLIGIIGDGNGRTAMVEHGASKRYYTLSPGTYIGTNEGRVVSILPDRVIVEEKMETGGKTAQVQRTTLMLHKD